jgi:hypothetical protein
MCFIQHHFMCRPQNLSRYRIEPMTVEKVAVTFRAGNPLNHMLSTVVNTELRRFLY